MLGKLIEWSARNVFIVLLATLALIGGGIYAVKKTPLDALPEHFLSSPSRCPLR